jgi:hypothetical protein
MKITTRYSPIIEHLRQERGSAAIIEQMREERRARLKGGGVGTRRSNGVPPFAEPVTLAPRVLKLKHDQRFANLFQIEDPTEQAAVLEDIQTLVDRCHYHHVEILSQRESRNLRMVRGAAMQLARPRGRPKHVVNFAASQFGLGLAMIWWEHTGRRPSRYESERLRKRGRYFEFVQMVVNALPPSPRKMPGGKIPSISYLVMASVKEFKVAMKSSAEYRRRGLIDERHWLGSEGGVA